MPLGTGRVRKWQIAILTVIGGYLVSFAVCIALVYGPWVQVTMNGLLFIAFFLLTYVVAIMIALMGLGRVARAERLAKTR